MTMDRHDDTHFITEHSFYLKNYDITCRAFTMIHKDTKQGYTSVVGLKYTRGTPPVCIPV